MNVNARCLLHLAFLFYLTDAIEEAAFEYLKRLLVNRLLRLLSRRAALALTALVGGAVAGGLLPIGNIIGLLVSIGIVIWTIYDIVQTIRNVIDGFRSGMYETFKRIACRSVDVSLLDCLDRRPECCKLAKDGISRMLKEWVRSLRPGWKRRGRGGHHQAHRIKNQIRRELAGPLAECCTMFGGFDYATTTKQAKRS